jgi:hypothetical protein
MLPKKGIVFPNAEDLGPYCQAIAYALKCEQASTHQATKIDALIAEDCSQ